MKQMKMADPLNQFKDKVQAFRVAKEASILKEFAVYKNKGVAVNTFVSAKEKERRKKRKKIAKQSMLRNRKG
jgi:hypothetical protein